MRAYLFIHQNFPGQYRHIAAHLAKEGNRVVALGDKANVSQPRARIPGVALAAYSFEEKQAADPFVAPVLKAIARGRSVAAAAARLRNEEIGRASCRERV